MRLGGYKLVLTLYREELVAAIRNLPLIFSRESLVVFATATQMSEEAK
jgi:hypothetical protein